MLILAQKGRQEECVRIASILKSIGHKLGYWAAPLDKAFYFDSIGRIYEGFGMQIEAEKTYREALAFNPHFASAQYHLANLLFTQERPEEAREVLDGFLDTWRSADEQAPELVNGRSLAEKLN